MWSCWVMNIGDGGTGVGSGGRGEQPDDDELAMPKRSCRHPPLFPLVATQE